MELNPTGVIHHAVIHENKLKQKFSPLFVLFVSSFENLVPRRTRDPHPPLSRKRARVREEPLRVLCGSKDPLAHSDGRGLG